jgi:5-methyltetrahydropteroyltriglutamate--homocysteine methyltransferase
VLRGYSREQFLGNLVREAVADIRGCLKLGAHKAQIDFTEPRLSLNLDPSGGLLQQFIDSNNQVLGTLYRQRAEQDRRSHLPGEAIGTPPTALTSITRICCHAYFR